MGDLFILHGFQILEQTQFDIFLFKEFFNIYRTTIYPGVRAKNYSKQRAKIEVTIVT